MRSRDRDLTIWVKYALFPSLFPDSRACSIQIITLPAVSSVYKNNTLTTNVWHRTHRLTWRGRLALHELARTKPRSHLLPVSAKRIDNDCGIQISLGPGHLYDVLTCGWMIRGRSRELALNEAGYSCTKAVMAWSTTPRSALYQAGTFCVSLVLVIWLQHRSLVHSFYPPM